MSKPSLLNYSGVALVMAGALLLVVCRFAGWQTNEELLIALSLVILGYVLHVWLQKRSGKY